MTLKTWKSRTLAAGGNAKTVKGDDVYQTAIMYLAPYLSSGVGNLCATADIAKCHEGCLFKAGRADIFESVNTARIAKTKRYFANRAAFITELVRGLESFTRHCRKIGVLPAVRLNGTSDIQWEVAHPCTRKGTAYASLFAAFPEIVFYDYTKIVKRAYRALPSNYSLTLSYSGANMAYAESVLKAAHETGANIAVVYRSKDRRNAAMADRTVAFLGREVINGDETDMRFLDPKNRIVGLYAKGRRAKKDQSGFIID
jgi:hypothetical protein